MTLCQNMLIVLMLTSTVTLAIPRPANEFVKAINAPKPVAVDANRNGGVRPNNGYNVGNSGLVVGTNYNNKGFSNDGSSISSITKNGQYSSSYTRSSYSSSGYSNKGYSYIGFGPGYGYAAGIFGRNGFRPA